LDFRRSFGTEFLQQGHLPDYLPIGRVVAGPPPGNYWRFSEENAFLNWTVDKRIWWGKDGNNVPKLQTISFRRAARRGAANAVEIQ
jgi:hypothetical protein